MYFSGTKMVWSPSDTARSRTEVMLQWRTPDTPEDSPIKQDHYSFCLMCQVIATLPTHQ